jgi:type II secretory pathway component PulJ
MKAPPRRSGERSEAGETLIEVLIASALMGLVVVAIIGGLASVLLGSKLHRDQADGNRTLVGAMERLKSADVPRRCVANGPSHPYYALASIPSAVKITTIEYEVNRTDTTGNYVDFDSTAACDLTSQLTLQRITLIYTSADNAVTPSLSFIKGAY